MVPLLLVDGLKGNGNYKTGRWIAFYKNDMDVTIDMQQPTEIASVEISTCVEKGDWVFDARGLSHRDIGRWQELYQSGFRGLSGYDGSRPQRHLQS